MGAWEDGFKAGWRERDAFVAEQGEMKYQARVRSKVSDRKPKKRGPKKPSAYNRFMAKEMKKLRRKHPRMKQPAIMKKAAKAWRAKKRRG